MFRRKEESATDFTQPAAPVSRTEAMHGDGAAPSIPTQNTAPISAAPHAAGASYVPTASASRPASPQTPHAPVAGSQNSVSQASHEPVRTVSAAAPVTSYRPTPIAEFNRGAARSTGDAVRSPAPNSSTSFGAASDKSSAPAKSNRRVLTVGNDILLKGEIATCDRLVIEGRVEAKLSEVHTVEIAECGSFKGTAEVEDAEISGVFEGDLVVRNRLVIYTAGEVRGNISYGEIEIERGGRLTGQIKTVASSAKGKSAFDASKSILPPKETAAA